MKTRSKHSKYLKIFIQKKFDLSQFVSTRSNLLNYGNISGHVKIITCLMRTVIVFRTICGRSAAFLSSPFATRSAAAARTSTSTCRSMSSTARSPSHTEEQKWDRYRKTKMFDKNGRQKWSKNCRKMVDKNVH
jgi:hypothetical protein